MLHDFDQLNNLVHMLASSNQTLKHKDLEIGEHVSRFAAHHVHVLLRQLEGRILKADVLSGRVGEDEPVVDVNEVTLAEIRGAGRVSISHFLDASSHLYKPVCLSVRSSVRPRRLAQSSSSGGF